MTQPLSEQSAADDRPLPIDIDYAKCLPWLIDRRRVPRDWHVQLKTARTLARSAWAQTSPEIRASLELSSDLSAHEALTYAQVRRVYEQLIAEDAPEHWGSTQLDLLGRHVDPIRRAWKNALSAFEKNHVFLADLAQNIVRNVDVEAPALRTRIAKLTADAADLVRKDGPAARAVTDALERLQRECAQYNICPEVGSHDDFHSLISQFLDARVPLLLRDSVVALKGLRTVVSFYKQFAGFVSRPHSLNQGDQSVDASSTLCPVLTAIFDVPEASLVRPVQTSSPLSGANPLTSDANGDALTGGSFLQDTIVGNVGGGEIDWGIEIDDSGLGDVSTDAVSNEGIDWSIDAGHEGGTVPETVEILGEPENAASTIDWDITVDSGEGDAASETEQESEPQSITLLDGANRKAVLNDVYELRSFLDSRISDTARVQNAHVALNVQLNSAMGTDLGRVTVEDMQGMQSLVKHAIGTLASQEARHILGMYDLPRARERAARNVGDKRLAVDRLRKDVSSLSARRTRVADAIAEEAPKLAQLATDTWRIVDILEQELSKLYGGRDVHILGEIHNVLPHTGNSN